MMDIKAFDKILSDVIKAESGIKKVILVDRTGLTIAHVSKFSYYPVDIDGIGAIASAVYCASEEQGKNLDIGELNIVTSEFDNGKIFAASCGKGVLCVITDSDVNIGMIRLVMKKASTQLKSVLDEFLAEKPVVPASEGGAGDEELKAALSELEKV
ncbi:MAG: roadblock/LC7 domain-containing protein [Candidatus Freyarchaeota archaeon]|nr:roadblock/LC7 domain-containing protein [Candidatus Jordarchaeia archaeon]MBS7268721.1 roadblock/LC7 domain-containing protein [Candidatus Jordarchaeia archaeon]MBS7279400.1 roadblock/LC7 domain-containing protein [Candidatus Jordarchaeia archaeon]